ncbi:hypothetical protein FJZ18_01220 [Candidatus Pacearchaeota archaeon]|nr:hypothetical protein [Candidatus Pacearchaeota archaeon]
MDIEKLKNEYAVLEKKYKLSTFSELNSSFDIEKIDDDTELLAKNIRKIMMDKILNSVSWLDMLINQMNAPRIYQPYFRTMSMKDKENLIKIYDQLGALSLTSLSLEIDSNEKKECDAIKEIYSVWKSVKPSLIQVIDTIRIPPSTSTKKERNYFG